MKQTEKQSEHGCFTGPVGSNQSSDATRNLEIEVPESNNLAIVVGQPIDLDDVALTHLSKCDRIYWEG